MRLLILVAALASSAHARGFNEAYRLINEWRIAEARPLVEDMKKGHPDDAETVFLDGYMKFLHGEYGVAAERLRDATLRLPSRGELAAEARELRDLALSTGKVNEKLVAHPSGHFVIYAAADDALLVDYAAEALEAAYRALSADFGDETADPVRVEIYGEVADLAKVSTLTQKEIETSGTIALCKYNRLMIVSPRALLAGYPWLDTLNHEYTHFVVSRVSHNSVPIWLHEGLAKFEERRWRGANPKRSGLTPTLEHLLASGLEKKHLISFEQMHPSMAKLPSQEDTALAFAEVYMAVEYLIEEIGWSGIRRVLGAMRDGKSDADAVAGVVGGTFADFQRRWRAWLEAQKLRKHPGLFPTELHFRKNAQGKRGASDELDGSDIKEKRAKEMARLGGMLRVRGRMRAAAAEYEKAQAILGPGNPQVSHRLGRTYLEIGEPARAIAVVEPALANYPELAGPRATLGAGYLALGDFAKAEPHLLAALAISPFDPALHCGLEKVYRQRADVARADREAKACRELKP